MALAETLLVIGVAVVGGWYVINYVLPNLPGGSPFGGGQFVEGSVDTSASSASSSYANGQCKAGNNGGTCFKNVACNTSAPYRGVSYRGKSVAWCVRGGCTEAKFAWQKMFKCADLNSTPKPAAPAKKMSGKSGNCSWDGKGVFCWDSTACSGHCNLCASVIGASVANGCAATRNHFIANASKCPSCKIPGGATPAPKSLASCPNCPGGRKILKNNQCACEGSPNATGGNAPTCPGKSGNCTWDCKNAYCWTSTGPKANKVCVHGGTNRSQGCDFARSEFLAYNAGTPTKPF